MVTFGEQQQVLQDCNVPGIPVDSGRWITAAPCHLTVSLLQDLRDHWRRDVWEVVGERFQGEGIRTHDD